MNTRKRKNRYVSNQHNNYKKRKQSIEVGMTGFLCTCNFYEEGCVKDAYKLLNLFSSEEFASEVNKVFKYTKISNSETC